MGHQSKLMKKLIYILASAALLGACEQKTEVVAPVTAMATPDPANTGQKIRKAPATLTTAAPASVNTKGSLAISVPTAAQTAGQPDLKGGLNVTFDIRGSAPLSIVMDSLDSAP